jgi:predicted N-acetyltransferase YhbS
MGNVSIRRATPEDVPAASFICYDAFATINKTHNFPPDIPSPEIAAGFLQMLFNHPGFYCVVAEEDGRIIGSNCLDERSPIAGIGPITIDTAAQNKGVGRSLMRAVMDRAAEQKFPGVRLVQATFHNRSLSLYAALGFNARELLSVMQGPPINKQIDGCSVRPARTDDVGACNRLCRQVHGHHRGGELADAIQQKTASVVERSGRITAYTSGLGLFGHAVGETLPDLQALIAAAQVFEGPGILVPTCDAELFRWCLANGLRVVEPMTLMTIGLYNEPQGAYLPSVLF